MAQPSPLVTAGGDHLNTFIEQLGMTVLEKTTFNDFLRLHDLDMLKAAAHSILNHRDVPKDAVIGSFLRGRDAEHMRNIIRKLYYLKPTCGVCGPGVVGKNHVIENVFKEQGGILHQNPREYPRHAMEIPPQSAHGVSLDVELGLEYVFTDAGMAPAKYLGDNAERKAYACPSNLIDSATVDTKGTNNLFLNIPIQIVASEHHLGNFGVRLTKTIIMYNLVKHKGTVVPHFLNGTLGGIGGGGGGGGGDPHTVLNHLKYRIHRYTSNPITDILLDILKTAHYCVEFVLNSFEGIELPFGYSIFVFYDSNHNEIANPLYKVPVPKGIFSAGNHEKNEALHNLFDDRLFAALSRKYNITNAQERFFLIYFIIEYKLLGDANHCIFEKQICDIGEANREALKQLKDNGQVEKVENLQILNDINAGAQAVFVSNISRMNSAFGTPDYDVVLRFMLEKISCFYTMGVCVEYYPGQEIDIAVVTKQIRIQKFKNMIQMNNACIETIQKFKSDLRRGYIDFLKLGYQNKPRVIRSLEAFIEQVERDYTLRNSILIEFLKHGKGEITREAAQAAAQAAAALAALTMSNPFANDALREDEFNDYCLNNTLRCPVIYTPKKDKSSLWDLNKLFSGYVSMTRYISGTMPPPSSAEPLTQGSRSSAVREIIAQRRSGRAAGNRRKEQSGGGLSDTKLNEINLKKENRSGLISYIILTEYPDIIKFAFALYITNGKDDQSITKMFSDIYNKATLQELLNILEDDNKDNIYVNTPPVSLLYTPPDTPASLLQSAYARAEAAIAVAIAAAKNATDARDEANKLAAGTMNSQDNARNTAAEKAKATEADAVDAAEKVYNIIGEINAIFNKIRMSIDNIMLKICGYALECILYYINTYNSGFNSFNIEKLKKLAEVLVNSIFILKITGGGASPAGGGGGGGGGGGASPGEGGGGGGGSGSKNPRKNNNDNGKKGKKKGVGVTSEVGPDEELTESPQTGETPLTGGSPLTPGQLLIEEKQKAARLAARTAKENTPLYIDIRKTTIQSITPSANNLRTALAEIRRFDLFLPTERTPDIILTLLDGDLLQSGGAYHTVKLSAIDSNNDEIIDLEDSITTRIIDYLSHAEYELTMLHERANESPFLMLKSYLQDDIGAAAAAAAAAASSAAAAASSAAAADAASSAAGGGGGAADAAAFASPHPAPRSPMTNESYADSGGGGGSAAHAAAAEEAYPGSSSQEEPTGKGVEPSTLPQNRASQVSVVGEGTMLFPPEEEAEAPSGKGAGGAGGGAGAGAKAGAAAAAKAGGAGRTLQMEEGEGGTGEILTARPRVGPRKYHNKKTRKSKRVSSLRKSRKV